MRGSVATSLVAIGVVGLSGVSAQTHSGGSAVPCAAPLPWRVARVDAQFGITEAQAAAAVQRAAEMWERGVGRALFRHDAEEGFPIRLVYDERQERSVERGRREGELAAERRRLDGDGEELRRLGDRHAAARAAYNGRQRELDARVDAHNADIRAWNERGGAPEEVVEQMDAAAEVLREERAALEAERRALEVELRALQEAVARVNRANAEHAARAEALARDFPSETTEAGQYREAVQMEGRRIVSIGREIRVYRFASAQELTLIVAHELGHALGLGHSSEPGAVMSAAHESGVVGGGVTRLQSPDLALLGATCPRLVGGGG